MIGIIAILTARDGHGEPLATALQQAARLVRANEPGCLFYQVTRSRTDPNVFKLLEAYESQEALDAHRTTAHFPVISASLAPHLGSAPQVEFLDALG